MRGVSRVSMTASGAGRVEVDEALHQDALRPRRAWSALAISTLLFGVALWFRGSDLLWLVSGLTGAASLALAFWAHPRCLAGLATPTVGRVLRGVAGAVVMAIGTYVAYGIAATTAPDLVAQANVLYDALDAPPGRWLALPVVALVVAAEEVVWRGLGVELVSAAGRPKWVVWAFALALYVVPQLVGGSVVLILLATVAGGVWTAQRLWEGNVVTPFVTHLVWDVIVFVLVPLDGL